MQTTSTLIIGAGLTGLSCAHHLRGDYVLVEKENEPGGIVRTRVRQGGFQCDGTGHWLHLRNADMKALVNLLLPRQLAEYERKAVIHLCGAFTPYPFQANTYGLPREGVISALPRALAASLSVPPRFNTRVTRVDLRERTATLAGGEVVRFRRLVNTMALPRFVATLAEVPKEIRDATAKLRAATVHY